MRKLSVILIASAMALLTGCGSQQGLSDKSNGSDSHTHNPVMGPFPGMKPILLKDTDTDGVMSFTLYDVDSKTLTEEEVKQIDRLAFEINAMRNCQVSVVGHADNIGTSDVNEAVSLKRARLVSDFLKSKGVENITTYGASYYHPVAGNETAEGRAKNRRVEIFVSTTGKYNPYKK